MLWVPGPEVPLLRFWDPPARHVEVYSAIATIKKCVVFSVTLLGPPIKMLKKLLKHSIPPPFFSLTLVISFSFLFLVSIFTSLHKTVTETYVMENVEIKLLESEISAAKKYQVSIGSYRGMIFDSSSEVEAAVSWVRTIQKRYAIHRHQKGMVIGVSLDGPAEGPFTHLTLFVGKYGISVSMEGGLPKPIEIFLQKPRGFFFSGYDMLEKKCRLEKQTGITIANVLELKQGAVELHVLVAGLRRSSYGVVLPVDASEEERAKYYFLAAFEAFMVGKEKIKEIEV